MTLFVDRFETAVFHMRINLGGADAGVAEHFLKSSNVSPASQ